MLYSGEKRYSVDLDAGWIRFTSNAHSYKLQDAKVGKRCGSIINYREDKWVNL